jgi:hypothetical protein
MLFLSSLIVICGRKRLFSLYCNFKLNTKKHLKVKFKKFSPPNGLFIGEKEMEMYQGELLE